MPHDSPEPLGNYVVTIIYHDENLCCDVITRRLVIGVLRMLRKTPIDCHGEKQTSVETVTFGSEYSSARTCIEHVLELRVTCRHLGVPLQKISYVLGCNDSVVNSSITPHGKTHKSHVALSFYRVRKATSAKIITYYFINGKINPADILSKHWARHSVWKILNPLLFLKGDTME